MIGIDEQRDQNARLRQALNRHAHFVQLAGDVQAAFGGHFFTFFRHQAAEVRLQLNGDVQHLVGHRHLQIHARLDGLAQQAHIAVGDVAAIFAQMHGNAVGPACSAMNAA